MHLYLLQYSTLTMIRMHAMLLYFVCAPNPHAPHSSFFVFSNVRQMRLRCIIVNEMRVVVAWLHLCAQCGVSMAN